MNESMEFLVRHGYVLLFGILRRALVAWKAFARWRFIRTLRTDRIAPEELYARIGAGNRC